MYVRQFPGLACLTSAAEISCRLRVQGIRLPRRYFDLICRLHLKRLPATIRGTEMTMSFSEGCHFPDYSSRRLFFRYPTRLDFNARQNFDPSGTL
jgi:hypothetical protein